MVIWTMVACSSVNTGDAGVDRPMDAGPTPVDGGAIDAAGIDAGPLTDRTTGLTCVSDRDCDKTDAGINVCSEGAFSGGASNPTSVCIGKSCDVGDGTTIMGCDGDLGVCLSAGSGSICLPACTFDDSTAAPRGCVGKNVCNVYGFGRDDMMRTVGTGYCFGGCKVDADCPGTNKCQKEDGRCVTVPVVYVKSPGAACTVADSMSPAKCNCGYSNPEGRGYCITTCRFGEAGACGTGFSCDPGLPKTKVVAEDIVFTAVPTGLAGACLKNCATDADCVGLNAHCDENAGMAGQKTCIIGPRR